MMSRHGRLFFATMTCLLGNLLIMPSCLVAFTCPSMQRSRAGIHSERLAFELEMTCENQGVDGTSRRSFMEQSVVAMSAISTAFGINNSAWAATAAKKKSLDECLYTILRVREATQQETRLLNTGKFKDLQRANVKLAVGLILDNYRLADTLIAASSYIESNSQRIDAGNAGQRAVQSLYTILEYFDSADVQNIKVGTSSMEGKEGLVVKGLASARTSIDEFLAYFPRQEIDKVRARIEEENEMNRKEFDPALGTILNPPPEK